MSEQETIVVRYSCAQCGLRDVTASAPTRGEENVVQWLEGKMIHAVADDHRLRSPHCTADSIQDLKIPIDGRAKVGGPVLQ